MKNGKRSQACGGSPKDDPSPPSEDHVMHAGKGQVYVWVL